MRDMKDFHDNYNILLGTASMNFIKITSIRHFALASSKTQNDSIVKKSDYISHNWGDADLTYGSKKLKTV